MKIIEVVQLGLKTYQVFEGMKGIAPELVDVLTRGQATIMHVLHIYDDGTMTVKERDQAARNIQSSGKEMADLVRLLPAVDEPVVAPTA